MNVSMSWCSSGEGFNFCGLPHAQSTHSQYHVWDREIPASSMNIETRESVCLVHEEAAASWDRAMSPNKPSMSAKYDPSIPSATGFKLIDETLLDIGERMSNKVQVPTYTRLNNSHPICRNFLQQQRHWSSSQKTPPLSYPKPCALWESNLRREMHILVPGWCHTSPQAMSPSDWLVALPNAA